jgi:cell division protein FtsI (penicillin-binding protein 3)
MAADGVWGTYGGRIIQRDSSSKKILDQGRVRLVCITAIFALSFGAIACRLVEIAFHPVASKDQKSSDPVRADGAQDDISTPLTLARENIVDRQGEVLATTLSTQSLFANPRDLLNPENVAQKIAKALPDLKASELAKKLKRDVTFVWIKRNLTPKEQRMVNNLGIPGLYFQPEQKRVYPQQKLLSHVLGYVGLDNNGLAGIERFFDKQLRDTGNNRKPLELSIDLRVQNIVNEALKKGMESSHAIGATGMVLDVHTGEILALSNLPDFDPHQSGGANTTAHFNRASLGTYEMGSTFKTFTTAMALEYGVANINTKFDATRPIHYSRFTINDTHPENRWLTVPEIYTYSSNIGTVRMAMAVGAKRQQAFLKKMGFMEPLTTELPEIGVPQYPSPENWKDISMMTISYGQGISVTPLHLARAFAAVVNGGKLIPLTLKKGGNDGKEGERVLSEKTSRYMRRLMRMVVEHGTAKKADVAGYRVGGKTGTAEKAAGGGYNEKAKLALFISTFPVDAPKYVVFVIIDEPKPTKATYGFATGGWNAAPVVHDIISRIGPMLGVPPIYDAVPEDAENKYWVDNANQKFLHAAAN